MLGPCGWRQLINLLHRAAVLIFNNRVFLATLYISLGVAIHFTKPFRLSNPLGDADYVAVWINEHNL
jgi:hypothetical protein